MDFGSPVRHKEQDTIWFRVPLINPYTVDTSPKGVADARTCMLQTLLRSKGLFSTIPTLQQLGILAPVWQLPDSLVALHTSGSTWSKSLRWESSTPSNPSIIHVIAVWISRSLIVPELRGTAGFIDLDLSHPELEEVNEIESSEGMVHLRSLDLVRQKANETVNHLWKLARTATEEAEAAEEAFFQKYGESFSEDSDSDDSN